MWSGCLLWLLIQVVRLCIQVSRLYMQVVMLFTQAVYSGCQAVYTVGAIKKATIVTRYNFLLKQSIHH